MAYAEEPELRSWMNVDDSVDDPNLALLLDTASEWIDTYCDRTFGASPEDPSATVPEGVRTACLLIAARLSDRRQSPGGVLGTNELGVIRVTGVDRDVEQLLAPHRNVWGVA